MDTEDLGFKDDLKDVSKNVLTAFITTLATTLAAEAAKWLWKRMHEKKEDPPPS